MSGGWQLIQSVDGLTGQRVYFDAAAVPSGTSTTLPELGDVWETGSLAVVQSITKAPIGDDTSAGYAYTVTYGSNQVTSDPLSDDDVVSISVTSAAEYDSWSVDPGQGDTAYSTSNGTDFVLIDKPLVAGRMNPIQNVTITQRVRSDTPMALLQADAAFVGKVNASAMWSYGAGQILYTGMTASPVKELDSLTGDTKIQWNVQYNYQIRTIKGWAANQWEAVFYKGKYVRLSSEASTAGYPAFLRYETASIPDPLS
jgi:hypothetical protein